MTKPAPPPLAFDVYGTLFDPGGMAEPLRRHVEDAERVAVAWRAQQLEVSWLLSLVGRYEPFDAVTRYALEAALAVEAVELSEVDKGRIVAGVNELELYDDVAGALDELDERGFALAVLSNGSPPMLEALLERGEIRRRFAEVVSVDEVGVYTPARAVYEHAARRLGSAIEDVYLVSANPFDAAGAKSAGMRVAKVERGPSFQYGFADVPDCVVRTLADLPSVVSQLEHPSV